MKFIPYFENADDAKEYVAKKAYVLSDLNKSSVPVYLHIPKCAGTYVTGWNMLFMRYYGILNKWNEMPGWNGTLKIVDVLSRGNIILRAFVWLKKECPWKLVGTNGAETSVEDFILEFPSCGFLFSIIVESHGVKFIRDGILEEICSRVTRQPAYYTIMRSPLNREQSLYNYLSSSYSSHEPSHGRISSENFEQYIFTELADNWVTREVAGVPEDRLVTETDFLEAQNTLNKFIVGDIKNADDILNSVFGICYNISINDIPITWTKDVNNNAVDTRTASISDEALNSFKYRTRFDMELYNKFSKDDVVGVSRSKINKKIYAYHEQLFENQSELLELWKESWERGGFEPVILTQEDAQKSPYYDEFLTSIKQIHLDITGFNIRNYGIACYIRWLAYSTQEDEGAFYVSDYDVINNGFDGAREFSHKLNHLGGHCPCVASGSSEQFLEFCKDIINVSIKYKDDIKRKYQNKNYVWYHDQEFLAINREIASELYNIVPNKRYITQYEHGETNLLKASLIHVPHTSVGNAQNKFPELRSRPSEQLRVDFVKSIMRFQQG